MYRLYLHWFHLHRTRLTATWGWRPWSDLPVFIVWHSSSIKWEFSENNSDTLRRFSTKTWTSVCVFAVLKARVVRKKKNDAKTNGNGIVPLLIEYSVHNNVCGKGWDWSTTDPACYCTFLKDVQFLASPIHCDMIQVGSPQGDVWYQHILLTLRNTIGGHWMTSFLSLHHSFGWKCQYVSCT